MHRRMPRLLIWSRGRDEHRRYAMPDSSPAHSDSAAPTPGSTPPPATTVVASRRRRRGIDWLWVLGVVLLLAWGYWWALSFVEGRLVAAERTWVPWWDFLGLDFL